VAHDEQGEGGKHGQPDQGPLVVFWEIIIFSEFLFCL
jgi:hypothetical protein